MDVATIDIGTHTVQLVIAQVVDGRVTPLREDERFARLGAGVDARGSLDDGAIARVVKAVRLQASIAQAHGISTIHAVATSAARDARNTEALESAVASLGITLEVIDGEEEARWAHAGALSGLPDLTQATVIDIGGGSTEIAWGTRDARPDRRTLQLGSVRLTERGGPPERRRQEITDAISAARLPPNLPRPWIAADSPGTTLATLEAGLCAYDAERLEGTFLDAEAIGRWEDRLWAIDPAETLALAPQAMAGREDLIAAGAMILSTLVQTRRLDAVRVTGRGLAHGWAARAAGARGG
jgi:exopolyphosphatase/guanosine-5'-triphosphate,3'-diphosphate pyrophosphatase